jgi:hypothetical protein
MLNRNPQPASVISGDTIVIIEEEDPYKGMINLKLVVLEIDLNRKDRRVLKLGQFNGNPIHHISDPTADYWTKINFVQVDKRTVGGIEIYYETNLSNVIQNQPQFNLNAIWFFGFLNQ